MYDQVWRSNRMLRLVVFPVSLLLIAGCATAQTGGLSRSKFSLDVVQGGDDGLTQKMVQAIRAQIARDGRITNSVDDVVPRFQVVVPNVKWKNDRGTIVAKPRVSIARITGGSKLSKNIAYTTSCPEVDLTKCAHAIVERVANLAGSDLH